MSASMTASSALLVSIFPIEVECPRNHNGFVNYMHPAARKDTIGVGGGGRSKGDERRRKRASAQ